VTWRYGGPAIADELNIRPVAEEDVETPFGLILELAPTRRSRRK
jgi:hypothetical protein